MKTGSVTGYGERKRALSHWCVALSFLDLELGLCSVLFFMTRLPKRPTFGAMCWLLALGISSFIVCKRDLLLVLNASNQHMNDERKRESKRERESA